MRSIKVFIVLSSIMLLSLSGIQAQFQCELTNNPAEVKLIYDDIQNFMAAWSGLDSAQDPESQFHNEYITKASPGLKEYLREGGFEANDYLAAIKNKPAQYASLKDLKKQLVSQEINIRRGLLELRKIIPSVSFMPVYYFVGLSDSGLNAQPSPFGLTLAISELAEKPELIRLAIVHETVHVQQAIAVGMEEYMQIFGPKMSLLALSIREGTAYYLTLLSTGEHTHTRAYDYLIQNEREIWNQFKADMNNRDPGEWMFRTPKNPETPADLGYVIGARIVEAYYTRAENKEDAIQEILSVTDFPGFLIKSGYPERFANK